MKNTEYKKSKTIAKSSEMTMYRTSMNRITKAEEKLGTLKFTAEIPDFKDLKLHEDEEVYRGQKNTKGEKDGFGIKIYSNDSEYIGMWKGGKKHGQGWFFYDDESVYKGDWVNGLRDGKGVYLHADGSKFEGKWVEDEQTGYG